MLNLLTTNLFRSYPYNPKHINLIWNAVENARSINQSIPHQTLMYNPLVCVYNQFKTETIPSHSLMLTKCVCIYVAGLIQPINRSINQSINQLTP